MTLAQLATPSLPDTRAIVIHDRPVVAATAWLTEALRIAGQGQCELRLVTSVPSPWAAAPAVLHRRCSCAPYIAGTRPAHVPGAERWQYEATRILGFLDPPSALSRTLAPDGPLERHKLRPSVELSPLLTTSESASGHAADLNAPVLGTRAFIGRSGA